MELREYQKKVINRLREYLIALNTQKEKYDKLIKANPDLASDIHFPKKAWKQVSDKDYLEANNGLGEPLPNVFLKVPTGGGKTLIACHAIDVINKLYLQKQNGMVLWIVPTTQIYSQTLASLRDRNHPYRQLLDISSGGKTLILEKLDQFNLDDVKTNLCVLLLMLPSASRRSKETLKVFKDNSGYTSFFPPEDAYKEQEELLKSFPNLDTFGESGYLYGNFSLTSLGNVLKLLKPITIVDEGHKAYSPTARNTIYEFNPSFVLELSATPPKGVNKLVEITGTELNDEQMIKLDLHLINKKSVGWQETLSEAVAMRDELENSAKEHEQNTNIYIRPIMLIQVERTGKDQRDTRFIHTEDVKEYLLKQLSIPEQQIAIKSSDKDEIEGLDLLDKDCSIRFIITQRALQEGWDCSFAYVLCVLTQSHSETAMTQLIGRVLRQPYAHKTGIQKLDESYVYSFQQDTAKLVHDIKRNLEGEGLGDIVGSITVDDELESNPDYKREIEPHYREKFKKFEGKIYLPVFAILSGKKWREVSYETDLLAKVDWSQIDLSELGINIGEKTTDEDNLSIGYVNGSLDKAGAFSREYESEINLEYIARRIIDVVPNPWVAYAIAEKTTSELLKRYNKEIVASNLVFVMEGLHTMLSKQREALSEKVFHQLLSDGTMKFYLLQGNTHSLLPKTVSVRSRQRLTHKDGDQLKLNLFDYVPGEDINELEKDVALYLDNQHKLLWWYRNMARADYRIQGWKPHKVYPDFIATNKADDDTYDKVYILETKGDQLAGNVDTEYKRKLLKLCSKLAVEKSWNELDFGDKDSDFIFQMVDEHSWENQLNTLIGN